jgi:phage repressor protein C with HTH and peptisase S24 domain
MAEARLSEHVALSKSDMKTATILQKETAGARERLAYTMRDCQSSVEVFDNSLSPTLRRGDIAYLDDAGEVSCEGIYAFHYQGKPHIKRISCRTDGTIRISADGSNGTDKSFPQIVEPGDINIIGRVVYAWRSMDAR